jgi:iron complex transport system substrate-binding protein
MLGCNIRQGSSSESERTEEGRPVAENVGVSAGVVGASEGGGVLLNGDVQQSPEDGMPDINDSVRYAAGYQVTVHDGYTSVEVRDPWNKGKLLQRYLLTPRDRSLPKGMPEGTIVRVPLRKMVVYTSVHCAALDALGVTDDIVGVCESRYINVPAIKERIREGLITDLGEATSPGVEKMIEVGTEVVFASPFDHGSYGAVEKLGIPIIECADYMENDPLGRVEWIKFLGLLTGRSARADSLFRRTEANYLRIKALVEDVAYRPKLMTGMKYGSSWYVPSGESFMARIYKDAGADYIFRYLSGAGSTPLSFENVLDKAIHADIWLVQYNREENMTYDMLQSEYSSYSRFDAFRDRHIYGCNTNCSPYYEEVPIHPDYLLAELIAIFHPQILPDHNFRYFFPLAERTAMFF